jgi:hypothetical protein
VEVALTLGPWTHFSLDQSVIIPESMAWLDAHVSGERPPPRERPVRAWVGGRGEWLDLPVWPPEGVSQVSWYLQPNGCLSRSAPATPAGSATGFRYDPADPTPSVGGRIMSVRAGQRDNSRLEARPDVLTFTSPALERPVEVLGAPVAELLVSSDNPHIDLFARLCDVDPRGRSRNITDQIIRLPGEGMATGEVRAVRIVLDDTAHRFLPGHRIRLQVSGGAHPRFARNLGTGEHHGTGIRMAPSAVSIRHDPACASALLLPATES